MLGGYGLKADIIQKRQTMVEIGNASALRVLWAISFFASVSSHLAWSAQHLACPCASSIRPSRADWKGSLPKAHSSRHRFCTNGRLNLADSPPAGLLAERLDGSQYLTCDCSCQSQSRTKRTLKFRSALDVYFGGVTVCFSRNRKL